MTARHPGNPEAQRRDQRGKKEKSSAELFQAIERIRSGKTLVVTPGTRLCVATVAREAKKDRSGVYKHPDVLAEIRGEGERLLQVESTEGHSARRKSLKARLRERNEQVRVLGEELKHAAVSIYRVETAARAEIVALTDQMESLQRRLAAAEEKLRQRNVVALLPEGRGKGPVQ